MENARRQTLLKSESLSVQRFVEERVEGITMPQVRISRLFPNSDTSRVLWLCSIPQRRPCLYLPPLSAITALDTQRLGMNQSIQPTIGVDSLFQFRGQLRSLIVSLTTWELCIAADPSKVCFRPR